MENVSIIRRALITGPTGAVGISLIFELINQGIEVTAVCRPNSSRLKLIPNSPLVNVIECDLKDIKKLTKLVSGNYDAFFHFAWDGTYGDLRQNIPLQTSNILFTLDAVDAAMALGCKVFIGAGSQSEFGHVDGILHPDMPCKPDNGYGIAKLAAGQLSRIRCKQFGIRHEWCRIISLYGPFDGAHTMVMSGIYEMLCGKEPAYTKGEQIWDYIYSKDAAKAFRLIAEKGKDGSVYCLGSGKTRKLREYIFAIRDAIDPEIQVRIGELDYYPNQVMHLEADITNLVEDTGFSIEYTFERGIRETVDWAKENM